MSNKKVTIPFIKEFNPCQYGLDNLTKHYPKLDMLIGEFLKLEHIPYEDKLWLSNKIVDITVLKQWAVECAEQVLSNYNEAYPSDSRITDCIETTKRYLEGNESLENLNTARSAARSAAESAAWSAARSAACAAWSAAWSTAASTAESAAESTAWSAARSAAWSAAESAARSAESAA